MSVLIEDPKPGAGMFDSWAYIATIGLVVALVAAEFAGLQLVSAAARRALAAFRRTRTPRG
jgi:hypothetical protein